VQDHRQLALAQGHRPRVGIDAGGAAQPVRDRHQNLEREAEAVAAREVLARKRRLHPQPQPQPRHAVDIAEIEAREPIGERDRFVGEQLVPGRLPAIREDPLEGCGDQLVLGLEVAVEQRLRHAQAPRDLARGAGEALLGEELGGGVQDRGDAIATLEAPTTLRLGEGLARIHRSSLTVALRRREQLRHAIAPAIRIIAANPPSRAKVAAPALPLACVSGTISLLMT
jgi:hypothetical protein